MTQGLFSRSLLKGAGFDMWLHDGCVYSLLLYYFTHKEGVDNSELKNKQTNKSQTTYTEINTEKGQRHSSACS